jgi:hypothetical protein
MIRLRSLNPNEDSRALCDGPFAVLSGEYRAKPVPPEADGLVADVGPALGRASTLSRDTGYRHQMDDPWASQ